MYKRIPETTPKTLLMEVLSSSTPTYSGNCKAFLETSQYGVAEHMACRAPGSHYETKAPGGLVL